MKMLVFAMTMTLAMSAQALELYSCDLTATAKSNEAIAGSKKMYLLTKYSNHQEFGKTALDIQVVDGKLSGSVNGQPNFILGGTPENGHFESAYIKGTVRCSGKTEATYMLMHRPWKQFYSLEKNLSSGHILKSLSTDSVYFGQACFIGDADAAAKAITSQAKATVKSVNKYEIQLTFDYTYCAEGAPSYPGDDDCSRYETKTVTKPVPHCYEDGWVDPRS